MEKEALAHTLWRLCRSSPVRLVLFSLLTWLAVACLMVFLLQEERRHAERKAEADALGISALLEARLAGIMQRVQADLEYLALTLPGEAYRREAVSGSHARVVRELGLHSRLFPEVAGFRILDAGGTLLYASKGRVEGENFGDRSYFKAFANSRGNGLFLSEVLNDRLTGRPVLNVAVPARDDAGGGWVSLSPRSIWPTWPNASIASGSGRAAWFRCGASKTAS